MLTIFATLFLLGVLVVIHEFGHFIIARLCDVKVEKFSFGFGPKLFGKTIGETEYRVSLIPFGGYVKMFGENPDETEKKSARSFQQKKWWQKNLIAFGGPFANFIFAIFILSVTFMIGIKNYDVKPIIGQIQNIKNDEYEKFQVGDSILAIDNEEISGWNSIIRIWNKSEKNSHKILLKRNNQIQNIIVKHFDFRNWLNEIKPKLSSKVGVVYYGMPAYQAGIQENDVIISINDEPISSWYDMRKIISKNPENPLQFVIKRGDGIFNCTVIPQINPGSDEKFGFIGIRQKTDLTTIEKFNFFTSIKFGFISTISRTYDYYDGIIRLFKTPSQIRKNLGGPLMIAAITGQQAEQGIDSFLSFMAMVSIILMVMNLLPIPILDGGLILFGFIEGIRQKPLKAPTQAVLQKIGLSIILALMIFAFYNDISKILFRNF